MLHLESKLYKGKTVSSLSIGLLGLHLTLGSYVIANPTGGNVTHGNASISSAGSTLNVNQLTDKAVIDWNSFSIAQGETTQFNQPSASSAVLNRVVGGDISKIYGNLKANGQVFLINGNGILIGKTGVIDTAGFLATTHSIEDADFLNGGDLVLEPGKNLKGASIINLGKISASGGDIFLIADHVTNEGIINASNGTAGLAAARGSRVLLAESGDQRILIQPSTAAKTDKDGVINKGTIKAVNAEIKAAGGNIYALAINNNGVVRATGVQKKGGRILLTSKNGKIKLGKNSRLNASGKKGGGKINVGGNKQGKGDVAIAKSVTTEKGSKLTADAIESGNGGSIIVFAEGNTSIAGDFSTQGGALSGNGGFIETSGKQNLLVANGTQVNTSAANGVSGTWLLDPTNFTISAGSAASTPSGIGADTLVGNLGNNNVLIQTAATGNEDGDITVDSALSWTGSNSLTLMAHHDIIFNASVQHDGSGDLNLIAGWDGTTAFNATTFDTVDVNAGASLYGNNDGSIFIGTGAQTSGIAVASRNGATRAYGHDLNILAGTGGNGRYAQLGFQVSDQGIGYTISGGINARVLNNINATGGAGNNLNYAQLGHIGADQIFDVDVEAAVEASIHIAAGNNLSFESGGGFASYSQLGHGGFFADGSHSGTIMITSANDLSFMGGGGDEAYSQLGHGGDEAHGSHSGTIMITSANDLSFMADGGNFAYSQLGHGGIFAVGSHSGTIMITSANDLSFMGGDGTQAYSQLGHGGLRADGDHSGEIRITSANDLSFMAGGGFRAYSQLGHGGENALGDHGGEIRITSANDLSFMAGGGDFAYSQLGHGGLSADGDHSGEIRITSANDLSFVGGSAFAAYSQLGHGGVDADGIHRGLIDVTVAENLTFTGQDTNERYALLGHGDELRDGDNGETAIGNVLVRVAGDVSLTNANLGHLIGADGTYDANSDTYLGVGGQLTFNAGSSLQSGRELRLYLVDTMTNVTFNRDPSLNGNTVSSVSNLISGNHVFGTGDYATGADVAANGNFAFYNLQAVGYDYEVEASHASNIATALNTGEVILDTTQGQTDFGARANYFSTVNNITVNSALAYDSTNNLNLLATGDITFNDSVQNSSETAGGDLNLIAGWDGTTAFNATTFDTVDVNAAASLYGNNDGSIFIGTGAQTSGIAVASRNGTTRAYGHDLNILAGTGDDGRYAQLGFQVSDQGDGYSISGGINARVLRNITATGGAGNTYNYAQLGHIGADQAFNLNVDAAVEASISIAAGNNLSFVGGGGLRAYSQLGHGGENADGDHSGEIRITSANDLSFMAGGGFRAYSQLGHGGLGAAGDHSGDIRITSANDLSFMASGNEAYSQFGHGGIAAVGDHSGDITITSANDLSFMGGGFSAYSQLGHGGAFAIGSHSGEIRITSANDLSFMAGGGFRAYSQLGHGGVLANGDHSGDIVITSANDLSFMAGAGSRAYSQLGHGGLGADGNHSGDITITSANDLSFMAGGGDRAYSQLGHGGAFADGNHSGLIDVTVAGNLTFTGQNASNKYALLGHGDEPGDSNNGDTVSGNVLVRVAGDVGLTNAYLGHLIDADGTYEANSDTYLGIGGQLSFNAGSSLQSGRELRLYLAGTTSSVVFNADASLNGNTVSSVANVVGDHTFGTGSYATAAEITANGNFAFYNTGTTGSTVGGVRETQSEDFWSWVSREGEFLGGASPELIEFLYFKGDLQQLRHLLNLEQQSKKGTREMTEEERGKLRELLSSQSSVASSQ